MKKILVLLGSLVLAASVCACAKEDVKPKEDAIDTITMQQVYDAFQREELLENNDSIHLNWIYDGKQYSEEYYTKDCYYDYIEDYYAEADPDIWEMFVSDNGFYEATNCVCTRHLYIDNGFIAAEVDCKDWIMDAVSETFIDESALKEEIISVIEEDGKIIVKSVEDKESMLERAAEEGVEGIVSAEHERVLDAETLAPISDKGIYGYEDGTVNEHTVEYTYNTEMPEGMNTFVEYYNQTEDVRTGTFVFNPGTDNEKTETISVPKGMFIRFNDMNYETESDDWTLYADEACTEEIYESADDSSDFTVYVKAVQ